MPEYDANLIVLRGGIENLRKGDIHGGGHRVFRRRPIQLDPQDGFRTLGNNVTHGFTSYAVAAVGVGFDAVAGLAPGFVAAAPGCVGFLPTRMLYKPATSVALKPSSLRTSSLCSPMPGARFADTLLTPCT